MIALLDYKYIVKMFHQMNVLSIKKMNFYCLGNKVMEL